MDEGGKGLSNESKNDALMTADGTGKNPNDWTIVGLVLPSPGDLRRELRL